MHTAPDAIFANATLEELHVRHIDLRGFRRSDGLYQVEGRLVDRKPRDFEPVSGGRFVAAGDAVHDMGVRLVYDDQMLVHAVQTFTQAAPYEPCSEGGRALQQLVGLRMARGWNQEVRNRLGGAASCTHLRELLGPMATVAMQSLSEVRRARPDQLDARGRPLKIDSCYAYGAGRSLVQRLWPQHYRPAAGEDGADAVSRRDVGPPGPDGVAQTLR